MEERLPNEELLDVFVPITLSCICITITCMPAENVALLSFAIETVSVVEVIELTFA